MASALAEDAYILKRDYDASTRLTAGHYLYKNEIGYLLHPSITLPPHPRIADVATGNGLWLLDISSTLPSSSVLEGFDLSLDQVPNVGTTDPSPQIRFRAWNMLHDPPKEIQGAFDVVHVRLITVVIEDNDPVPIIRNLKKLIKPGGFLQWEEVDNVNCHVVAPIGSAAPALTKVLSQLASSRKSDWKGNMINILDSNGFTNAERTHVQMSGRWARYWDDLYMSTWAEYVKKTRMVSEETNILAAEAMVEVRRGSSINCPLWVWIAQKP